MFTKSRCKPTKHRFHPGIGGLIAIAALFVALVALAAASAQRDGYKQTALARSSKCQSARVGDIYARQCSSPKGSRGPRGPRGLRGLTGPIGPTGLTGPAGPLGPKGDAGPPGPQGAACSSSDPACKGPKGDQGATCSSSDPACKGPKGDQGAACSSSDPACKGPKGDQGAACSSSDPACKGPKGDQGAACSSSDPACKGPKGDQGAACSSSDPACKGPKGDPGPSDLYASKADRGPLLRFFANTNVLLLDVPAGAYLVTARVNIGNVDPDPQNASCKLSTDTGGVQEDQRLNAGNGLGPVEEGSFKLQDAERFNSPTTIILQCSSFYARFAYARLAAIKVGTLH